MEGNSRVITQPQQHGPPMHRRGAELEANNPLTMECVKCANARKKKRESNMKNDQKYPFITESADLARGGR